MQVEGLGTPGHLVRRFFQTLTAQELTAEERAVVSGWLSPGTAELFFSQPDADQRHGYEAARFVVDERGDHEQTVAALLHDVGKRHARMGVIGRSVASIFILARLPLPRRMRLYRDHGPIGADELAALTAPALVVDFARHHHGDRPTAIPPDTWDLLVRADQPHRGHRAKRE